MRVQRDWPSLYYEQLHLRLIKLDVDVLWNLSELIRVPGDVFFCRRSPTWWERDRTRDEPGRLLGFRQDACWLNQPCGSGSYYIVVVTNNRGVEEKMFLLPLLSFLLVYYTTLKYLINVHNGKPFHLAFKEGQSKTFSINLNAQHVNGMTHFDLTGHRGKHVRLLDTLSTTKLGQFSQRYNNSWLSPSIYGGEILRQASLRSCPNGFSLSNCLKTHQEDEKLSHVKNVATWPCTSNLTNWTTGHRMSTPTSKVGDWEC